MPTRKLTLFNLCRAPVVLNYSHSIYPDEHSMSVDTLKAPSSGVNSRMRTSHIFLIMLATLFVTIALTFWFVPRDFTPVKLDQAEQKNLNNKLRVLGYQADTTPGISANHATAETDQQWLRPEKYQEQAAQREVSFNERELNALIANNRELAKKLSLDLSDQLLSARLLVPLDPDFPLLGGKTLRVSAGVELAFHNARPRVVLKGVSLMGLPIPNAWLGGLKNIDLISEFGDEAGFWSSFAEGVEHIEVQEGRLMVRLKP